MKQCLFLLLLFLSVFLMNAFLSTPKKVLKSDIPVIITARKPVVVDPLEEKLSSQAAKIKSYIRTKGFSTQYCFIVNLSMPSGRNRFFVYDLQRDTVLHAGLVAHGSCNTEFVDSARFSNTVNGGCSSAGRYKVGYAYPGRFGKAYKLIGLDSTNSNAFRRHVVLHAYSCVPDQEVYPDPICNSLGCPMVSYKFLKTLATYIDISKQPILLWILNDRSWTVATLHQ